MHINRRPFEACERVSTAVVTKMNWIIRHAVPNDCPAILQLIKVLTKKYFNGCNHYHSTGTALVTIHKENNEDLAVFENYPESVVSVTPEVLQHDCFGKNQWFHCLVAEQEVEDDDIQNKTAVQSNANKKLVGYAIFYHAYSTWKGRMLFLEDLYVAPSFRKNGIGMGFLTKLSQIAIQKGCYKIKWLVLDWNQTAIDFYKNLGAEVEEEWRSVVFDNRAMTKLANEGS